MLNMKYNVCENNKNELLIEIHSFNKIFCVKFILAVKAPAPSRHSKRKYGSGEWTELLRPVIVDRKVNVVEINSLTSTLDRQYIH